MNCSKNFNLKRFVTEALKEDVGRGDITAKLTIPVNSRITAVIVAREAGILCGIDIVKLVFKTTDNTIKIYSSLKDGSKIYKSMVVAEIQGEAKSILSAERVALNFLGFLSGIATCTRAFVKKAKLFNVKILDTRKTLPCLRALEKYAVRVGGGFNHRFCLDEMILIKENHIDVAGWKKIYETLKAVKTANKSKMKVEIEARNLEEFKDALFLKPDIIMLDNMAVKDIREAVRLRNKVSTAQGVTKPKLEASGNISLNNIVAYASCGIDFISLGTLTKDIASLDFSLEVK
jgi:nicotinate-nucleotide pyrophosphorylase (carboxylating)